MKKIIASVLVTASLITAVPVNALVHVNGYYRSNGTYVAPHVRTNPDGNSFNNFSSWR